MLAIELNKNNFLKIKNDLVTRNFKILAKNHFSEKILEVKQESKPEVSLEIDKKLIN